MSSIAFRSHSSDPGLLSERLEWEPCEADPQTTVATLPAPHINHCLPLLPERIKIISILQLTFWLGVFFIPKQNKWLWNDTHQVWFWLCLYLLLLIILEYLNNPLWFVVLCFCFFCILFHIFLPPYAWPFFLSLCLSVYPSLHGILPWSRGPNVCALWALKSLHLHSWCGHLLVD